MNVKIEVENGAKRPHREHESDSGYDLYAFLGSSAVEIGPGGRMLIYTGIRKMEMERGYEAQIRPCSGNALKKGITVLNTPGTIDAGYRGNVCVILYNSGDVPVTVNDGDKIAQMVFCKLPDVDMEFCTVDSDTDRGDGGFGSTGGIR